MELPWDVLRRTSPDVLSIKGYPVNSGASGVMGCWKPVLIAEIKQNQLDRPTASCRRFRTTCNLKQFWAGCIMSTKYSLAVTDSMLMWSKSYSYQYIPLRFLNVFPSYLQLLNHSRRQSFAWWEWIRNELIDRRFVPCCNCYHPATMQTQDDPLWTSQCSQLFFVWRRHFYKWSAKHGAARIRSCMRSDATISISSYTVVT